MVTVLPVDVHGHQSSTSVDTRRATRIDVSAVRSVGKMTIYIAFPAVRSISQTQESEVVTPVTQRL